MRRALRRRLRSAVLVERRQSYDLSVVVQHRCRQVRLGEVVAVALQQVVGPIVHGRARDSGRGQVAADARRDGALIVLVVLEHDAYFTDAMPSYAPFASIINFGKPSYGKWVTPPALGVNQLISKQYLPGAHAYGITPKGAEQLIEKAKECASPTDVFISNKNFKGIQEYYPWPVEARDSFSTIQKTQGCLAKHNYNETYELI